ncbi:endonuclease/exonuclease/phosphatase family protein [Cellulophaga baltica]|uniref:endonuclease/exonuclease/phosphatase family protein n=1 Tax=Cellulophaga TaxID=104264 RepID=UPI001C077CCD|nr:MULTISPECIES: endonuclease/exonuclease/phosphatase family protein [Cellulophaga]MBU2998148.1 endonuclease/exonuclease/phosphatase family protein [Cellulophaga baltica]MDO6769553.1 endonuclease/exonuclease/phosphatase family protein [Cellulophaga sp. 1_MG-2023]
MLKKILLIFLIFIAFEGLSQNDKISLMSWNIRDFGQTKSSEELDIIAEILHKVDIIAIQEVVSGYGGAQAVAKLTAILNRKGNKWDYVISNPTNSSKYATERYAFVWKTKLIKIKNRGRLIKELDSLIDREPFLLDFYMGKKKFTVLNFHSKPFDKDPESEIKALTEYVKYSSNSSILIAGDFNIDQSKAVFNDLKKSGFKAAVSNKKTTLKRTCGQSEYLNHAIDNIFYSQEITKLASKVIDFVRVCENLDKARKLSDHLPVYFEFILK